jgi:hypothetical protein
MKTLKIRFVKNKNCAEKFSIQRLTWYGRWKDIGFEVGVSSGEVSYINSYLYRSTNKQQLLDMVIDDYFKVSKSGYNIIEYPMIKLY